MEKHKSANDERVQDSKYPYVWIQLLMYFVTFVFDEVLNRAKNLKTTSKYENGSDSGGERSFTASSWSIASMDPPPEMSPDPTSELPSINTPEMSGAEDDLVAVDTQNDASTMFSDEPPLTRSVALSGNTDVQPFKREAGSDAITVERMPSDLGWQSSVTQQYPSNPGIPGIKGSEKPGVTRRGWKSKARERAKKVLTYSKWSSGKRKTIDPVPEGSVSERCWSLYSTGTNVNQDLKDPISRTTTGNCCRCRSLTCSYNISIDPFRQKPGSDQDVIPKQMPGILHPERRHSLPSLIPQVEPGLKSKDSDKPGVTKRGWKSKARDKAKKILAYSKRSSGKRRTMDPVPEGSISESCCSSYSTDINVNQGLKNPISRTNTGHGCRCRSLTCSYNISIKPFRQKPGIDQWVFPKQMTGILDPERRHTLPSLIPQGEPGLKSKVCDKPGVTKRGWTSKARERAKKIIAYSKPSSGKRSTMDPVPEGSISESCCSSYSTGINVNQKLKNPISRTTSMDPLPQQSSDGQIPCLDHAESDLGRTGSL